MVLVQREGKLEKDWMRQARLGDEQGVLVWGNSEKRFQKSDTWVEYFVKNNGEIEHIPPR